MRPSEIKAVPTGLLFTNVTLAPNVIETVVPPSINLNGIIIRTMTITVGAGSIAEASQVWADTAAPTAPNDFSKRIILNAGASANSLANATMPYPIYLYPGQGLWAVTAGAAGFLFITYDVMSPEAAQ
jgi:hypothetical protein